MVKSLKERHRTYTREKWKLKIIQCGTFILINFASVVPIWQEEEHFLLIVCYNISTLRLHSEGAILKHS